MALDRPQAEREAAMSKRPSVIGNLQIVEMEPTKPEAPAPVKRRERPDIVHTSVYLPKAVYQHLREIAFTRDVKIHDVIMEGISAALQKHGKPDTETLKRQSMKAP